MNEIEILLSDFFSRFCFVDFVTKTAFYNGEFRGGSYKAALLYIFEQLATAFWTLFKFCKISGHKCRSFYVVALTNHFVLVLYRRDSKQVVLFLLIKKNLINGFFSVSAEKQPIRFGWRLVLEYLFICLGVIEWNSDCVATHLWHHALPRVVFMLVLVLLSLFGDLFDFFWDEGRPTPLASCGVSGLSYGSYFYLLHHVHRQWLVH